MFTVCEGDNVKLRDGRLVLVTDAASSDPEDYRWYHKGETPETDTLAAEMPVETIFVGICQGSMVVSDMSEVIAVLNHTVL